MLRAFDIFFVDYMKYFMRCVCIYVPYLKKVLLVLSLFFSSLKCDNKTISLMHILKLLIILNLQHYPATVHTHST